MPSTSLKQKNFMAAVAKNPAFAKKTGVPQSVGADFAAADKGIKITGGPRERPDLQRVNKPETLAGKAELFNKGGNTMASKMNPGMMAMMAKKKDGMHKMPDGKMMKDSAMKMKSGGMPMKMKDGKKVPTFMSKGGGIESKGKTKGTMISMAGNQGLKKGGSARSC